MQMSRLHLVKGAISTCLVLKLLWGGSSQLLSQSCSGHKKHKAMEQPVCEQCRLKLLEGVLPSNGRHWELCSMPTWMHCSHMGMLQ